MLGIDVRAAKVVWTALLVFTAGWLIYELRGVIFLLLLSLFFAYMMAPLIEMADRVTPPSIPRKIVMPVIYATVLALLGAAFAELGSTVATQARHLGEEFSKWTSKANEILSGPIQEEWGPWKRRLIMLLQEEWAANGEKLAPLARVLGLKALASVGNLLSFLLIPVFAFFFLLQGRQLVDSFVAALPPSAGEFTQSVLTEVDECLGGYIRSLLLIAFITFLTYLLAFSLLGVPYAMLLAVMGGFLDFLPVIGPLIAIVTTVLVAIFSGHVKVLWLLLFFILYRPIQDYVIQPKVYSSGLRLNPLLVLIGAFAGERLAGIPGMVLSIPVMAVLRILFSRIHFGRVTA